jgi:DNA mismatch repair protein MutS2
VLDELGAGTDPLEGSALARAILTALLERGATTLVATHYSELKAFAQTTSGVRNASVEFDLETLRPTFHLTIGLPGRSNALAIAERLGLDQAVIAGAREMVSPEALQSDGLLDEIRRQRDAALEARQAVERLQREAQQNQAELSSRLEGIEDERRAILEGARREAEAEVAELRADVGRLRRRLAAAAQPLEVIRSIGEDVRDLEEAVAEPVARQAVDIEPEVERLPFRLGERVQLPSLGAEGVIMELAPDTAEVQIGRLRVRARLDELQRRGETEDVPGRRRAPPEARPFRVVTEIPPTPPLEVDLRGLMVDEALEELDRRLDAAYVAGMPFLRVIHGKGTGRLRAAIRQALKGNPYVVSFEAGQEAEGGDGVTLARLATI